MPCADRRFRARKRVGRTKDGKSLPGTNRGKFTHKTWSVIALGLGIDNKLD